MKRVVVIAVVLMLALSTVPVRAQDGELQCSQADIDAAIDEATALLQTGEYADLVAARSVLAAVDSLCLGLDFEGDADMVSDPVYVPEGLYRVTVTTEKYFIMHVMKLEGSCGHASFGSLFNVGEGEANNGADSLLESEGCEALWDISNVSAPYTVTFEKLK
ncbi:MAG: hypothetical protein JW966_13345 [Anaerolineae bacterium]|nr:hypothetical protein [Anaerolineae bacterium]